MSRQFVLEWNPDEPEKYLLSKSEEKSIIQYVSSLKKDIEEWKHSHYMWSKYHDSFWFQRSTGLTKDQMLEMFYKYAKLLDFYEPELNAYETILAQHRLAIEILHKDMTFLKKVNLSNTQLQQSTLF